ncbi:unnamed protein product [Gongylonema pulchrum]|uniref:Helicase ATP-binding domain-containing protein n=1 Tax=Gongylonema pulchrum TaxID=637853 RepID=A0A183EIC9_9BILA|nr:unnamed protein product [Gongylonema pulchrum]
MIDLNRPQHNPKLVGPGGEPEQAALQGFSAHRRNKYKSVNSEGNYVHEVVLPADSDYTPLQPGQSAPARIYEFQLDAFQRDAITCIDNGHSVLVSAHTSAGKSVVALYAIAMSLRDKQRVIYTSPKEALPNQIYRELREEFGDIGLMSAGMTLNPDASCLVMSTDILRSLLYRGSDLVRKVDWVIFDEMHYIPENGLSQPFALISLACAP